MDQGRRSRLMKITVTLSVCEYGGGRQSFQNEKRGLVIRGGGDFE